MSYGLPLTQQIFKANLGNCVEITRERGAAPITILQTDSCTSSDQGEITVTVGIQEERFDPAQTDFRSSVLAYVAFGIGGAAYALEADVKRGLQLTLPADSITIRAAQLEAGNPSPILTRVCASIGRRTRPSHHCVTRSYPVMTIAPAASENFPVPPFATSFFMTVSTLAANAPGSGLVTISGADQSVGYTGGQTLQIIDAATAIAAQASGGLALPQAARNIAVSNTSGAPLSYAVIYCLAV